MKSNSILFVMIVAFLLLISVLSEASISQKCEGVYSRGFYTGWCTNQFVLKNLPPVKSQRVCDCVYETLIMKHPKGIEHTTEEEHNAAVMICGFQYFDAQEQKQAEKPIKE